MKNVVECHREFIAYFNALETTCDGFTLGMKHRIYLAETVHSDFKLKMAKRNPFENVNVFGICHLNSLWQCLSLMPVPSACSKNIFTAFKFFCACSIFFEHSQIF